jgi:hypothetical protein
MDEVVSLGFVHFDLPHPSVRGCFAAHSLCPKLCLVHVKKADIGAKMSAVQAGVRMRTRACDGWGRSTRL